MESDAEITIAFIFKRSGKQKLKPSEFYLPLSMQLNWFSPPEAKDFVKIAIKQELLKEREGFIEPTFDVNQVKIPVGFHPTKQVFEIKKKVVEGKDLRMKIIEEISKKTNLDEKSIIDKINQIEQEKNITFEVAALLFGRDCDVDLDGFYEKIKSTLLIKSSTSKGF